MFSVVRSIILYGSESWTLTKADEEKLRIFERIITEKDLWPYM
jgi:hypothetical protein